MAPLPKAIPSVTESHGSSRVKSMQLKLLAENLRSTCTARESIALPPQLYTALETHYCTLADVGLACRYDNIHGLRLVYSGDPPEKLSPQ